MPVSLDPLTDFVATARASDSCLMLDSVHIINFHIIIIIIIIFSAH